MKLNVSWPAMVTARAALQFAAQMSSREEYRREYEKAYVDIVNAMRSADYFDEAALPSLLQRQAG